MRTIIYVDGYNFYSLLAKPKYSKYKWLDLNKFFQTLLPEYNIIKIKYFTAQMNYNKDKLFRQQNYIGALRHLYPDMFEFVYGRFENQKGKGHIEKQTDVNLTYHMVNDAWVDDHEYSVIVTSDTDFEQAMKFVQESIKFTKQIICIQPAISKNETARRLRKFKNSNIKITEDILKKCQLDPTIEGTFYTRPKQW